MKAPEKFADSYCAGCKDVPIILDLIRDLATYEAGAGTTSSQRKNNLSMFCLVDGPAAEVLLAFEAEIAGWVSQFYFYNFFHVAGGGAGLYLEDLFREAGEARGKVMVALCL